MTQNSSITSQGSLFPTRKAHASQRKISCTYPILAITGWYSNGMMTRYTRRTRLGLARMGVHRRLLYF